MPESAHEKPSSVEIDTDLLHTRITETVDMKIGGTIRGLRVVLSGDGALHLFGRAASYQAKKEATEAAKATQNNGADFLIVNEIEVMSRAA